MPYFEQGYALIIGVANYAKVSKLSETILKDAFKLHDIVRAPDKCGYRDSHVKLLYDTGATAENIREGLKWLAQSAGQDSTAFIYFSGHGWRVQAGTEIKYYLLPHDGDLNDLDSTTISGEELSGLLRSIPSQRLLFCLDSCYAAGIGELKAPGSPSNGTISGLDESYYAQLAQGQGRVIMASSSADETSLAVRSMNNSLFTHYLLEALEGKAHVRGDGLIRVFNIFDYTSEQIPVHKQHPIFKANDLNRNFPIALDRGGQHTQGSTQQRYARRSSVNKRELREAMNRTFDDEALNLLCADIEEDLVSDGIAIQVNQEMIGKPAGREGKILQLIDYLDRQSYLDYLIAAVRRLRPGII